MELQDLANQISSLHSDVREQCKRTDQRFERLDGILFGNGKEGWDSKLFRHERELGVLKKVTWTFVAGAIGSLVWAARMAVMS